MGVREAVRTLFADKPEEKDLPQLSRVLLADIQKRGCFIRSFPEFLRALIERLAKLPVAEQPVLGKTKEPVEEKSVAAKTKPVDESKKKLRASMTADDIAVKPKKRRKG